MNTVPRNMVKPIPMRFKHSDYPMTCAYMAGLGFDPERVVNGTVTMAGVEYLSLANGKPIVNRMSGTFATYHRPWPSLTVGIEVVASMKIEELYR